MPCLLILMMFWTFREWVPWDWSALRPAGELPPECGRSQPVHVPLLMSLMQVAAVITDCPDERTMALAPMVGACLVERMGQEAGQWRLDISLVQRTRVT